MDASQKFREREKLLLQELKKLPAQAISHQVSGTQFDDRPEKIVFVPIEEKVQIPNIEHNDNAHLIEALSILTKKIDALSIQKRDILQEQEANNSNLSLLQGIDCKLNEIIDKIIALKKKVGDHNIADSDFSFQQSIIKDETFEIDDDIINFRMTKIDKLSGTAFEEYIAELFQNRGYSATVTPKAKDYGIDVIVWNDIVKIGIQCKICNSDHLRLKTVQEVIAGVRYYKLDKGMVITNSIFTSSIIKLAKATNILLWDREILYQKIIETREQKDLK